MRRTTLLASALTVLLAGSASFAFAQSMPDSPSPPTSKPMAMAMPSPMAMRNAADSHRFRGAWGRGGDHQRSAVISDLHSLARLYMGAGRSKDMAAVYNDVLSQSKDPRVRNYVYHRLAKLQAQPTNVDQAIATLRKSLNENLANATRMRTEREQMRLKWQQHQKSGSSNAAATSPD